MASPASTLNVLVAGCGDVGTAFGLRLAALGHVVTGLRRDPSGLPPLLARLPADLASGRGLDDLPRGLDVVALTLAADGSDDASYRAAYVDAPRLLLEALVSRGERPRLVLFTSSTGVYGQDDGSFVDEASRAEPASFTGRRVLEGEAVLRSGPFRTCSLRLGGIYGPGRTRLIDSVREGRARISPGGPRWTDRIHRDDAAAALAHLALHPSPEETYLGVDREPAEEADVLRFIARLLGAPEPPVGEGAPRDVHRGAGQGKRCSSDRLVASGFRFDFPTYREGYAALVG